MKKNKVIVMMAILILTIIIPLTINATQIEPDKYYSKGPSSADVQQMYKFGGNIAGIVQIAGTIVSAGALIVIGIRYVVASAEEKAEYKERMVPYIIGAVLLFGATNIVNILYKSFISDNDTVREVAKIDAKIECGNCGAGVEINNLRDINGVECKNCKKIIDNICNRCGSSSVNDEGRCLSCAYQEYIKKK